MATNGAAGLASQSKAAPELVAEPMAFSPQWSPDGGSIIYHRRKARFDNEHDEMWIMDVATAAQKALPFVGCLSYWVPAGNRDLILAAAGAYRLPTAAVGRACGAYVFLTDRDGKEHGRLDYPGNAPAYVTAHGGIAKRDGSEILTFWAIMKPPIESELYISDANLMNPRFLAKVGHFEVTRSQWSPDGTALVYLHRGQRRLGAVSRFFDLWVLNGASGAEKKVTDNSYLGGLMPEPHVGEAWSQDGKSVICVEPSPEGPCSLALVNVATGQPQEIASVQDEAWLVTYSPSYNHIAYVTPAGLWVADAKGKAPQLLAPGAITRYSWAPDGNGIVFDLTGKGIWIVRV
jgi:hypothetical protein